MHNLIRGHTAAALGAALLATSSLVIVTAPSLAQEASVTVGGAPMVRSKNIVENAANSRDHTTLVTAVKAAGLVDTLSSNTSEREAGLVGVAGLAKV
jgi:uncharacterized surface protein with fasciclin (FAS1) repeats